MNLIDVIFLAFALSIDAMAVSFSNGLLCVKNKRKNAFLLALFAGFIGYFFANLIYTYVKPYSSIIAFIIFLALGLKFLYDALFKGDTEDSICCISLKCLFALAFATSIDALAAGVNLRFLNVDIFFSSLIIGLVTFLNALLGFYLGHLFKRFPSKYLEIFASLLLIFLAVKSVL